MRRRRIAPPHSAGYSSQRRIARSLAATRKTPSLTASSEMLPRWPRIPYPRANVALSIEAKRREWMRDDARAPAARTGPLRRDRVTVEVPVAPSRPDTSPATGSRPTAAITARPS